MSKKLNESAMADELQSSVYFQEQGAAIVFPPFSQPDTSSLPEAARELGSASPPVRPIARSYVRTSVRGRVTSRYAFEFFQDQVEELRRLSLQSKAVGDKGIMSEMVREAVDIYLETRRNGS